MRFPRNYGCEVKLSATRLEMWPVIIIMNIDLDGYQAEEQQSKTYHFGLTVKRDNHGILCAGDCTRGSVFHHAMDQQSSIGKAQGLAY
jgi:hypothetical protein